MGEIAESLILDLFALTIGTPQQMRGVHTAFVAAPCGDDVNRASPLRHTAKYRSPVNLLQVFSDYKWKPKKPITTHETLENSISADYERIKLGRNFRLEAYWETLGRYGFTFTRGVPQPNDVRVNASVPRVDAQIERFEDYRSLRARWAGLTPTPKIVPTPSSCYNIPIPDQETRVLLSPEESRAQASVFYGGLKKGYGAPAHHQPTEEELFIVHQGPLQLTIGTATEQAAQHGAFGFAPRFASHAFVSNTERLVTLATINSPGGHDRGFELAVLNLGPERLGARPSK
jgi:quercetin dioxygenase-like cupin family protein